MSFMLVMILSAVMGNLILSYFLTLLGQAGVFMIIIMVIFKCVSLKTVSTLQDHGGGGETE